MGEAGGGRIFLYGTLRRGASRDATVFYEGVRFLGGARVRGRLHDFEEYPGLRLDDEADWVVGELFDVTAPALVALDEWEGITPDGTTGEYRRIRVSAEREDGTRESCWVYEVSKARSAGCPVIASGDWMRRGK